MGYTLLGVCKFVLFGNPESARSRVEIETEVKSPYPLSPWDLVSQSWLLMLESQIGKIPKDLQDQVLNALTARIVGYFLAGVPPKWQEKTPDMRHLGTLEIELCEGNGLFVLVHPRRFDRHLHPGAVAGLIMTGSVAAVCDLLKGRMRDDTLYALAYAIQKWDTGGLPGWITAFTNTWDFGAMDTIVESGKQVIQQAVKNASTKK